MNFVIDLFHRSAESEGLRFDSSLGLRIFPTLVTRQKKNLSLENARKMQGLSEGKKIGYLKSHRTFNSSELRSKRLYEYFTVFHKNTLRHSSCGCPI